MSERDMGKNIKEAMGELGYGTAEWRKMPVLGEDYYFCEQLRRHQIPLHVDTGLEIGHIGKYVYEGINFQFHKQRGDVDGMIDKYGFGYKKGVLIE